MPEQLVDPLGMAGFGKGATESIFSPYALVLVLIAGILIWALPRNKAIMALFPAAMLLPTNQVLVIAGVHFPMLKILALFGMLRLLWAMLMGKENVFSGGINGLDVAMIVLMTFTAVNGVLLWQAWGEVIFQLGQLYTPCGVYFLLRFMIRDDEDITRTFRVWTWVMVVLAAVMIIEQATGRNVVYEFLGGYHADLYAAATVRGNGLRAEGTFGHAITAGTFGAVSFPMFAGLWWKDKKQHAYAAVGAVTSVIVAVAANSSTTYLALIAATLGLCCWPLRRHMRPIRWGIVLTIIALHLYMKSPVWSLIRRINLTGDSSTYHRFDLVNQCILHFWDWVLIGTKYYGSWGLNMFDLSNQYVLTADTGGIIPLISFLAILVFGYKYLGKARWAAAAEGDRKNELFIWALCAALFTNTVGMFGIDYFDQMMVAWYALLAIISAATLPARSAVIQSASVTPARPIPVMNPLLASGSMRNQRSK